MLLPGFARLVASSGAYEVISHTHDRNRRGRGLCRLPCRFSKRQNYGNTVAHERFRESLKPFQSCPRLGAFRRERSFHQ